MSLSGTWPNYTLNSTVAGLSGMTATRLQVAATSSTLVDYSNLTWTSASNMLTVGVARIFSPGTNNFFFGNAAGNTSIGVGVENMGFGTGAGANLTTGNRHTFFGYNAGNAQIAGFNNSFFGNAAGQNTTGSANSFFGTSAGKANIGGSSNVAVGNGALTANTSGGSNTAVGTNALAASSTINNNTAFGTNSYSLLTSGNQNVGVGMNSGFTQTTASNQVFVGYNAGFNVTGNQNIAIGTEAMSGTGTFGSGPNTGANNVYMGYTSGDFQQSGDQNVSVGSLAMAGANGAGNSVALGYNTLNVATGSFNIAIGSGVSSTLTSGSNNILIGKQLTPQSLTGDDQLSIMNIIFGTGNNAIGTSVSTGKIGIGVAAPSEKLEVAGNVRFSGALMPNNTAGAAGQVLTSGGAGVVPTWTTAGGITNTAPNNDIGKSNGTNIVPSGIFSTSAGNLVLGDAGTAGDHTISVASSTTGNLFLVPNTGGYIGLNAGSQTGQYRSETYSGSPVHTLAMGNNAAGPAVGGLITVLNSGTGSTTGGTLFFKAGSPGTGNNNGGNIVIEPGSLVGSGVNGFLIINLLPTSCAGAPTNAIANVAGVLTVCP